MTAQMSFGEIESIILFGGSPLLAEFAKFLKENKKYSVTCFSCKRQLNEVVTKDGKMLKQVLKEGEISFYSSEDICVDKRLMTLIRPKTLGLGFGEPWSFNRKIIDKFQGKLIDFMGIRLPQYRGGAHYSWQIMRKNRIGCCNLQLINEDMVQGVHDSGEIVKSKEYFFPPSARIPQDYFDVAVKLELLFLKDFLKELEQGVEFELTKLQENFTIYFPRLYTLKQGYINWNWKTEDIVTFICAFDDPYKGASTFIDNKRVFLKDSYAEFNDGPFHPFQSGLIYKKNQVAIFVATINGTVTVKKIMDEKGKNLIKTVKVGKRLYTPIKLTEESMQYDAIYDKDGIVGK